MPPAAAEVGETARKPVLPPWAVVAEAVAPRKMPVAEEAVLVQQAQPPVS